MQSRDTISDVQRQRQLRSISRRRAFLDWMIAGIRSLSRLFGWISSETFSVALVFRRESSRSFELPLSHSCSRFIRFGLNSFIFLPLQGLPKWNGKKKNKTATSSPLFWRCKAHTSRLQHVLSARACKHAHEASRKVYAAFDEATNWRSCRKGRLGC